MTGNTVGRFHCRVTERTAAKGTQSVNGKHENLKS